MRVKEGYECLLLIGTRELNSQRVSIGCLSRKGHTRLSLFGQAVWPALGASASLPKGLQKSCWRRWKNSLLLAQCLSFPGLLDRRFVRHISCLFLSPVNCLSGVSECFGVLCGLFQARSATMFAARVS